MREISIFTGVTYLRGTTGLQDRDGRAVALADDGGFVVTLKPRDDFDQAARTAVDIWRGNRDKVVEIRPPFESAARVTVASELDTPQLVASQLHWMGDFKGLRAVPALSILEAEDGRWVTPHNGELTVSAFPGEDIGKAMAAAEEIARANPDYPVRLRPDLYAEKTVPVKAQVPAATP